MGTQIQSNSASEDILRFFLPSFFHYHWVLFYSSPPLGFSFMPPHFLYCHISITAEGRRCGVVLGVSFPACLCARPAQRGRAATRERGSLQTRKPRWRLRFSESPYSLQFCPCIQDLIHLSLFYMHWHVEWLIQSWVNSVEGLVESQSQIESVLGTTWYCRLN